MHTHRYTRAHAHTSTHTHTRTHTRGARTRTRTHARTRTHIRTHAHTHTICRGPALVTRHSTLGAQHLARPPSCQLIHLPPFLNHFLSKATLTSLHCVFSYATISSDGTAIPVFSTEALTPLGEAQIGTENTTWTTFTPGAPPAAKFNIAGMDTCPEKPPQDCGPMGATFGSRDLLRFAGKTRALEAWEAVSA